MANKKTTVQLKIDSNFIICEKLLLINKSDYFKTMFYGNFTEKDENLIELKDVDFKCVERIVKHINGQKIELCDNVEECLAILATAMMLQFSDIIVDCENYLFDNLNVENCLKMYEVCLQINAFKIASAAWAFSLWNFSDFIHTPNFADLDIETLEKYLSCSNLNLNGERECVVWDASIKWIQVNEDERKVYLQRLLKCLNFEALSADDISTRLLIFSNLFTLCSDSLKILNEILSFKLSKMNTQLNEELNSVNHCSNCFGISKRQLPLSICCIGFRAQDKSRELPLLLCLDSSKKEFYPIESLEKLHLIISCFGVQICAIGPCIYILGGQYHLGNSSHWNNDFWMFNTITKKWKVLCPLPKPRRSFEVVNVQNNFIYVMCGYGRYRIKLLTCDIYDIKKNSWSEGPDLHNFFNGSSLTVSCSVNDRVLLFHHRSGIYQLQHGSNMWTHTSFGGSFDHLKYFTSARTYGDVVLLTDVETHDIYLFDHRYNKVKQIYYTKREPNKPWHTFLSSCMASDGFVTISVQDFLIIDPTSFRIEFWCLSNFCRNLEDLQESVAKCKNLQSLKEDFAVESKRLKCLEEDSVKSTRLKDFEKDSVAKKEGFNDFTDINKVIICKTCVKSKVVKTCNKFKKECKTVDMDNFDYILPLSFTECFSLFKI